MLINNRYQVIRSLGEGGFGQAYLAEDTQMPSKRRCVVKQLKPIASSTEVYELVQARFQREAAILEQLGENHPQVPRLYAYFTEDKNFYLAQEWVEGDTLESLQRPQPESTVRTLLISLLPVLQFIHDQGIIHRDIKPENIILRTGSQQPVLIDFGAVKETLNATVAQNSAGQNSTQSIVIGTPGYMATEQAAGRPLASSDLYSLALTAVYLLTGTPPAELPSDAQTGEILLQPVLSKTDPAFVAVLTKATRYHPRDRYSSAQEMLMAITAVSGDDALPTEGLQPTVIRPPASQPPASPSPNAQLPSISQPLTASHNSIETAPTQVKAPANLRPENQAQGEKAQSRDKSRTPVVLGLACLTIGGLVLGSRWLSSRGLEESTTDSVRLTNEPIAASIDTEPVANPNNPDKCFDLVAYDPNDSSVNVRDSPNGNIIETRPNLSLVQREGPANIDAGWNEVYISETGSRGYILGDLLYRTTYQVNDPEDTFANLRQTPNGDLITAVENGTEVQFLGTDGSWTQVELTSGQRGYISTSRLTDPSCF